MSVLGSLWAAIIRVANRNKPLIDAVGALPFLWGNGKGRSPQESDYSRDNKLTERAVPALRPLCRNERAMLRARPSQPCRLLKKR